MAIFPVWFYLHPRRGPYREQRKLVLVLPALQRTDLSLALPPLHTFRNV